MKRLYCDISVEIQVNVAFEPSDWIEDEGVKYEIQGLWIQQEKIAEGGSVSEGEILHEKITEVLRERISEMRDEAIDAGGSGRSSGI